MITHKQNTLTLGEQFFVKWVEKTETGASCAKSTEKRGNGASFANWSDRMKTMKGNTAREELGGLTKYLDRRRVWKMNKFEGFGRMVQHYRQSF